MKTIFMAFYINTINFIFKSIFWGGGGMEWGKNGLGIWD